MQYDVQTVALVGLVVAAVGGVVMYLLGHKHAVTKTVGDLHDTVHEAAHQAAEAVHEDVHTAVAGVVKVLDEVKDVRKADKPEPAKVEQPKPVPLPSGVILTEGKPTGAIIGDPTPAPHVETPKAEGDADKRQRAIDQAKATYSEAKDRLGADHPDVKQGAGDVMRLAVGHAQAVFAGR